MREYRIFETPCTYDNTTLYGLVRGLEFDHTTQNGNIVYRFALVLANTLVTPCKTKAGYLQYTIRNFADRAEVCKVQGEWGKDGVFIAKKIADFCPFPALPD